MHSTRMSVCGTRLSLPYLLRKGVGALPHEVPHRDKLHDVSARPLARAVDQADVVTVQPFHRSVVGPAHANTARVCVFFFCFHSLE